MADERKGGFATVILYDHEPLRSTHNYVREALGHAGVNTFPGIEGKCTNCEISIRSNHNEVTCPRCGTTVELKPGKSFSDWSYDNSGSRDRCDFIFRAARAPSYR